MDAKLTGALVARKRKEQELSQAELAKQIHVTDKAISRWETGRGMPGVDSLEPLAAALGLTVSELLSGRELTVEELPREAEVQIVDSLRKNKRMLWRGVLATVLALVTWAVLILGIWVGYHFFTSVKVDDLSDLRQAAEEQWPGYQVWRARKQGDYAVMLMRHEDDSLRLCVYERDEIFKNRWSGGWGKSSIKPGELATWNYGSPYNEAVIVVCGANFSSEARYYVFRNNDTVYLRPVEFPTLDLFVLTDGREDISATPILLDENLNAVDESRQDWVDNMLVFD